MSAAKATVASLYVHVPFCARKCHYCAFYSEPADGEILTRYLAALTRELERVAPVLKPRTVYFGGGTPSLLDRRQWRQILRACERLGLLGAEEWTVECNPATVSKDKARLWRDYGANRLSLGVQSLDATLLERLGRVHSREQVFRSFDLLRTAGFDNVNLDLLFAIPGQSLATWQATLREALAMGSEHLSGYEVTYEEDTPLFAQLAAGKVAGDEDLSCAMYEELTQQTASAGLCQYEIANFARDNRRDETAESRSSPMANACRASPSPSAASPPGFACRHNVNYWRGGDFIGLGPSATTYVGGVRTKNVSNTRLYCESLEADRRALASREALSPLARAGETAAFGLRLVAGWPFAEFQRVTGCDLRAEWAAEMRALEERGWGARDARGFRLTPAGLRFADAAAELFLRPDTSAIETSPPGTDAPLPTTATSPPTAISGKDRPARRFSTNPQSG